MGEASVSLGPLRFIVIHRYRNAVARSLAQADIPGYDGFKNVLSGVLPHILDVYKRQGQWKLYESPANPVEMVKIDWTAEAGRCV